MKKIKGLLNTLLIVLVSNSLHSQVFYKSVNTDEFVNLMEHGIVYFNLYNDSIDQVAINSIENHWKSTSFEIVEKEDIPDFQNHKKTLLARIDLESTIDGQVVNSEQVLALIPYEYLKRYNLSKYQSIGYIELNGFNQESLNQSSAIFMEQAILAMDQCVSAIKEDKITGIGVKLYSSISKSINSNSSIAKNKTMLVIGETKEFVDFKALEREGIKYKKMELDEFKNLDQNSLNNYILLYFSYNTFTDCSIFDFETRKLIFTWHYVNGNLEFDTNDIKKLTKNFD